MLGSKVRSAPEAVCWVTWNSQVRATSNLGLGTKETAGLSPENNMPVRTPYQYPSATGISTSLPKSSVLLPHTHSPKYRGGSGQLSRPGASPLGWGHALKELSPGKEGGRLEAALEPKAEHMGPPWSVPHEEPSATLEASRSGMG